MTTLDEDESLLYKSFMELVESEEPDNKCLEFVIKLFTQWQAQVKEETVGDGN